MAKPLDTLRSMNKSSFSEQERSLAVAEARALVARLETPWETGFRFSYINPACMACIKVGIELDLFKKWMADGGQPKTEAAIAKLVSCDPQLLSRIVCNLAATHMLKTVGPGLFSLTPFTSSLAEPGIVSVVDLYFDMNGPCTLNTPAFLKSTQYQMPRDPANGIFKYSLGKPLWEYLSAEPGIEATVGTVMGTYGANRPQLCAMYPTDDLVRGVHPEKALLVDVGGGEGHDVAAFAAKYPETVGKLVLQDRAPVIANATAVPAKIQKMAYDFFTPQPIKSAAAYYLHFILHDWDDDNCQKILTTLKPAMEKGYSKLLIHEVVLDTDKPEPLRTTTDIMMMAMASGMERTEKQWDKLLGKAGFEIKSIHHNPLAAESVIEAIPV